MIFLSNSSIPVGIWENPQVDIPAGTRRNAVVHLVEVGYTSDMRVHEHVQIKLDQHRQLRQNLLSYGWGRASVHAFIVGHTGVMSQAKVDILQELGA